MGQQGNSQLRDTITNIENVTYDGLFDARILVMTKVILFMVVQEMIELMVKAEMTIYTVERVMTLYS